MKNNITIDTLFFEEKDAQIFDIQDVKTKLNTLQNYFFPRLEFLVKHSLKLVQRIYKVNPYEKMSIVYRPSNRKSEKGIKDFDDASIGVTGKKGTKQINVFKRSGEPYYSYPSFLMYDVFPDRTIQVGLNPFTTYVDENFKNQISALIEKHKRIMYPVLSFGHINHWLSDNVRASFLPLHKAFLAEGSQSLSMNSPIYYFPISSKNYIYPLVEAFVILYPLLDSIICIADGVEPRLGEMLLKYKKWYIKDNDDTYDSEEDFFAETIENLEEEIQELGGNSSFNTDIWWEVLARDKWRCQICGHSAKDGGALLEVDRIIPLSEGGSEDISNLQTLCKFCKIYKKDLKLGLANFLKSKRTSE